MENVFFQYLANSMVFLRLPNLSSKAWNTLVRENIFGGQ